MTDQRREQYNQLVTEVQQQLQTEKELNSRVDEFLDNNWTWCIETLAPQEVSDLLGISVEELFEIGKG